MPSSSPNRPAACGRWRSPSWLCPPTSSPSPSWDATRPARRRSRQPGRRSAHRATLLARGVLAARLRVACRRRSPVRPGLRRSSSPTTSSCSRSRRSSCSRVPRPVALEPGPRPSARPSSSRPGPPGPRARHASPSSSPVWRPRRPRPRRPVLLVGEVHAPLAAAAALQGSISAPAASSCSLSSISPARWRSSRSQFGGWPPRRTTSARRRPGPAQRPRSCCRIGPLTGSVSSPISRPTGSPRQLGVGERVRRQRPDVADGHLGCRRAARTCARRPAPRPGRRGTRR